MMFTLEPQLNSEVQTKRALNGRHPELVEGFPCAVRSLGCARDDESVELKRFSKNFIQFSSQSDRHPERSRGISPRQGPSFKIRSPLPLLMLLLTTLVTTSCRQDQGREYWVDEVRTTQGKFVGEDLSQMSESVLVQMTTEGMRKKIEDFEFNPTSGEFSFTLDQNDLVERRMTNAAQKLAARGAQILSLDERMTLYARYEWMPSSVFDGTYAEEASRIPYKQFILPYIQADLLSQNEAYVFREELPAQTVGIHKVVVKDSLGTAIPDVRILGYSSEDIQAIEDANTFQVEAWQVDNLAPALMRTDAAGEALIYPLNPETKFRILAQADGYCSFYSEALSLPEVFSQTTITLLTCPDATTTSDGFLAQFDETLDSNMYEETISEVKFSLVYTNSDSVLVNVYPKGENIKGFVVRVYEGILKQETSTALLTYEKNYDDFTPQVSVTTPSLFRTTNLHNGVYSIIVRPLDPLSQSISILYGRKNTDQPSLDFASTLKAQSSDVSGIISGLPGATMKASADLCEDGDFLGFVLNSVTYYKTCQDHIATFQMDSIQHNNLTAGQGMSLSFTFFLKSKWGIESINDVVNQKNTLSLFIDYGIPNITTTPLTLMSTFGFVPKNTAINNLIYFFPQGSVTSGTSDTVILTEANLSSFSLRFASKDSCVSSNPTDKDGLLSADITRGRKIQSFAIGPNLEGAKALTSFGRCQSDASLVVDLPLKAGDITFPDTAGENASFHLVVKDAAGNPSEPFAYSIAPCPANVRTQGGVGVCWEAAP